MLLKKCNMNLHSRVHHMHACLKVILKHSGARHKRNTECGK